MPPLVTTGTPDTRGVLGAPGTQVLVGGNSFQDQEEDGFRVTVGTWLDCATCIEATYFFVNQGSAVSFDQNTSPVIGRPFFNVTTGMEDVASVVLPGLTTGSIAVFQDSQLWGGEVNIRRKHICCKNFNLDLLLGLRYMELDEGLTINETISIVPTVPIIGGLGAVAQDQFVTKDRLYAAQAGVEGEWDCGCFFFNCRAKIAAGALMEEVAIRGQTTRVTTTPSTVPGGFLALPTNIGAHAKTRFSAAPEVGFNVGCMFTEHFRAAVGYNLLYWTDVARPGNQIDRVLNPAQLFPGSFGTAGPVVPARPAFAFKESDLFIQGLTFSLEFRF
jgi:hypothetical protein